MAWLRGAITDGELDALARTAAAACAEDTRYPLYRGHRHFGGQCLVVARWLTHRLGGHVGRDRGHYVWLAPDETYYIDLTGHHQSGWRYELNTTYHKVETGENDRTQRFARRADRIFDSLDSLLRLALDYGGDSHPAEEPQREDDRERFNDSWTEPEHYWHDELDPTTPEGVYQFVYAQGQLEVSPNHSHEELSQHAGVNPATHTGPFAAGHVVVTQGQATWEVQSNVNLHAFFKILKDATKNYGWTWGGMTDAQGQPIAETFGPSKKGSTLHYVYLDDHLYLGHSSPANLVLAGRNALDDLDGHRALTGRVEILASRAVVSPVYVEALPHLFDWAADNGLVLYAGNDNVIKTIPDLQEKDVYTPTPQAPDNPVEPEPKDERLPTGLYQCPGCTQLFPNWREYSRHRPDCAEWADPDHMDNGDRGFPDPDPGLYGDSAHTRMLRQEPGITTGSVQTVVLPARSWKEAARVDGFMRYATAFGYDNDSHQFYVAYRDGDPLGYVAVKPDGGLTMMHSAVENQGVGRALWHTLTKYYDELYTGAAHEKTATLLNHYGWVQADGQKYRWAKGKDPKDLLEASLPFVYDVQDDKIFVGKPGARTSDIPGRFTPGGIVEGQYEPGGKVVIRSLTSIPYTVRHLIELWYYTHPHMEVKSVHLMDDQGKNTRLAQSITADMLGLVARNAAVSLASTALQAAGGQVYVVGGAPRDLLLGKEPQDIDLMVTGLSAEKVASVLKAQKGHLVQKRDKTGALIGKSFGTFRYRYKDYEVEIALPRAESSTGPGHKEFDVQVDPAMDPKDDFYRRDFTANAIGFHLGSRQIVDPFGGAADIASGTLRTLSEHSFVDDPLRIVRAIVALSRHGLNPDETTRAQMTNHAHAVQHLPADRIQAELDKLMSSKDVARGLRLAQETGVLEQIMPEVSQAFGFSQNNPHHELELGEHLVNVLARICERTRDPDLRMAALLHDIGKPASEWRDEAGKSHYYAKAVRDADDKFTGELLGADHAEVGAELARERLTALRYPTARVERICALVRHHMYAGFTTMAGARRFLARVGPHAEDLFLLRWADQSGKGKISRADYEAAWDPGRNRALVERVRAEGQAFDRSQLAITGKDLIGRGIAPGPRLGQILGSLTEQVIQDPSLNDRDTLLRLAQP